MLVGLAHTPIPLAPWPLGPLGPYLGLNILVYTTLKFSKLH